MGTMAQNDERKIIKVFLASPGDVQTEREAVVQAVQAANGLLEAAGRPHLLELRRWEQIYPAAHNEGPQGHLESALDIEDCDIVLGIFWKRFGTAASSGQTGTEHEIRRAYQTWEVKGKPQIMLYFSQQPYNPQSSEELDQWRKVLAFRDEFQAKKALTVQYNHPTEFIGRIAVDLTRLCFRLTAEEQQRILSCLVTADPRCVRVEGLTEPTGDLQFVYWGGLPTPSGELGGRFNIRVTVNVPITNAETGGGYSDAYLVGDLPPQESQQTAMFGPVFGRVDKIKSIIFENIPLYPPGPGLTRAFRIRNIRANVPVLGLPVSPSPLFDQAGEASGSLFSPSWLLAYLALEPLDGKGRPTVISDSVNVVGFPLLGLCTLFRGGDGTDVSFPAVLSDRDVRNEALACDAAGGKGTIHVTIRMKEGFPRAFKTASEEQGEHPPTTACVTNGTRFFVRFFNVPHRVQVFVTTIDLESATTHPFHPKACLVAGARANGTGGTLFEHKIDGFSLTTEGVPIAAVAIYAGSGSALWEWVSCHPRRSNTTEEVTFGLLCAVEPGHKPCGTVQVSASLAPVDIRTTSQPIGEPLPRFIDTGFARSALTFVPALD